MNKRVDYLDIAKGIGILLVVFGHALTLENSVLKVYVYSFHLPLFFLISGFLYKPEKYINYFSFFYSKVLSLVIPYITFSVISYFLILTMQYQIGQVNISAIPYIKQIIYGDSQHLSQCGNVALWFLPCLFIVENIFYWIKKFSKNHYIISVILLILAILNLVYGKIYNQSLPWSIQVSMIAVGFYGIGYIASNYKEMLENILYNMNSFSTICIFLISFVLSMINGRVDMGGNFYGAHIIFFYISAFAGVLTILKLSTKLEKLFLLKYFGRNSIVIFGLHFIMFQMIANYQLQRILFNSHFKVQEDPFTSLILYTVLGTLMTIPFVYVLNRFFPFLIGKKVIKKAKILR